MKYELIVHIWGKEAAGRVFWYLTIGLVVFPLVCDWPLSPTSSLDVWLSLSEALFVPEWLKGKKDPYQM